MLSLSQLSLLETKTAIGFDVDDEALRIQLVIDDKNIDGITWSKDEKHFYFEDFCLKVVREISERHRRVHVFIDARKDSEWYLLYQLRVQSGATVERLKVVDRMVVDFFRHARPVMIDLDGDINAIKLELRTLNKEFLAHPTFTEGDITVTFNDGTCFRTYRALLAVVSSYMRSRVSDVTVECVDVGDFPSKAFKELLLQLYPTSRPIWGDFKSLAKAALAFHCDEIQYKLAKHIIEFKNKPMTLLDRLKVALDMELHTAVEELVYGAARSGVWSHMVRDGFDPLQFFTPRVYREIVCPAVIAGQKRVNSMFIDPFVAPNFLSLTSKDDPMNVTLYFRGTPFYVNYGVLVVHGLSEFLYQEDGSYVAKFSKEMQNACSSDGVIPGKVLIALLTWLYPGAPRVIDAPFLRAAIIFCFDHGWSMAKGFLEQQLLEEPAINPEHYFQQLLFAEKYGLENMIRTLVFRAENSCQRYASELVLCSDILKISEETRGVLMERTCSGWSLDERFVTRIGVREPTSFRHRFASLHKGGAANVPWEETLEELNSNHLYGDVDTIAAC